MDPKVVIITLNFNQSKLTIECVKSILQSKYTNFLLLLIDNGSTEINFNELKDSITHDSRIVLKRLSINLGYVGGINFGLKEGLSFKPDFFIILNNDTIIDAFSIFSLVNVCEKYNRKAIVAGKVYDFEAPDVIQTIGSYFSDKRYLKEYSPGKGTIDKGQFEIECEMDMLDDILWILPSNLIEHIGYYSHHFFFGSEQADFALRAKKSGYKLIYTPASRIWHKGGATFNNTKKVISPNFAFEATKGSLIYQYRHTKLKFFTIIVIKSISKTIFNSITSVFKSDEKMRWGYKFLGILSALVQIAWNPRKIKTE